MSASGLVVLGGVAVVNKAGLVSVEQLAMKRIAPIRKPL